ncbi:MAG: tRNA pseudouridine(38-40) synthase TruA, partial [Gluconacetobacter sp.]
MERWAVRIEYDGRPFVGWQRQITGLSVQQVLEEAAGRLAAGRPLTSHTARRPAAGGH